MANHLIIGETRSDAVVESELVNPLLDRGVFDSLFLEAPKRGIYGRTGEKLQGEKARFEGCNSDKHDSIVSTARENNTKIYSLDSPDKYKGNREGRLSYWAKYIEEKAGEANLVLVRNVHLNRARLTYQDAEELNLPTHIERVSGNEANMQTIYSLDIGEANIKTDIYNTEEVFSRAGEILEENKYLPSDIDTDYVFVNS